MAIKKPKKIKWIFQTQESNNSQPDIKLKGRDKISCFYGTK